MSTVTSILASDIVSASRSTINNNFVNLNTDKLEAANPAQVLAANINTVAVTPSTLGANIKRIYKSADQTADSSVLASDNHLIIPIQPNEVWGFNEEFIITCAAAPDIKFGWSVPSTTAMIWTRGDSFGGDGATEATILTYNGSISSDNFNLHGTIFGGSVAGNIVFQWAQNVSTPSSVITVHRGSHIIANRLQ